MNGDAPGESEQVVEDFFTHGGRQIAASSGNRVGGPYVGAGRHCGNIGRDRDEHSGGGGLCSAGINIDDDWNFGIENCLGDPTHRSRQPPWGVQKNNQAYGLVVDRALDRIFHEILNPGIYRLLDLNDIDVGLLRFDRRDRKKKHRDHEKRQKQRNLPDIHVW